MGIYFKKVHLSNGRAKKNQKLSCTKNGKEPALNLWFAFLRTWLTASCSSTSFLQDPELHLHLAMLQAILVACVVGWIWAIKWACEVKTYNVARLAFIAGGGTPSLMI